MQGNAGGSGGICLPYDLDVTTESLSGAFKAIRADFARPEGSQDRPVMANRSASPEVYDAAMQWSAPRRVVERGAA